MATVQEIESRRDRVLEKIRSIRSMRRGSVHEQQLKVPHKGKAEPVLRGPYYVHTRSEKGKTVSVRLTTQQELRQARDDVAAHKRFVQLCQEFEQLTEQLGELERRSDAAPPKKKPRKSRSNKIEK